MCTILKSRPVISWAFKKDTGAVSEIFECDNKFVIAAVESSMPAGYTPMDRVAAGLKAEIAAQKKGEKIAAELASKNLTTLEAYADAMSSSVDSVKFVSFGTRRISGIGVEPKLNAAVSLAKVNEVSAPVQGNSGVYVFKVYAENQDAKEFDEAATIRSLDASNMYRLSYQAIQELINDADIEDNRIRFY